MVRHKKKSGKSKKKKKSMSPFRGSMMGRKKNSSSKKGMRVKKDGGTLTIVSQRNSARGSKVQRKI
jgi:hypothetical protein